MVIGVESPQIAGAIRQFLSDIGKQDSSSKNSSNISNNALSLLDTGSSGLSDLLSLSDTARDKLSEDRQALNTIEQGRLRVAGQELEFIQQQLNAINERVGLLSNLLASDSDQSRSVSEGIRQEGQALERLGRQLGLIDTSGAASIQETNVNVEFLSVSASFNSVARIETSNGDVIEVSQKIEFEFSFLEVSAEQRTISLSQDAATVQSKQATLVEAQLNFEKSENILVRDAGATNKITNGIGRGGSAANNIGEDIYKALGETLQQFNQTLRGFEDLIDEFTERSGDEDRVPPSLSQVIKKLLDVTGTIKFPKEVNEAA